MNFTAIDFETYYGPEHTIKHVGVRNYVRGFHHVHWVHTVALWSPERSWVGRPWEAPWEWCRGVARIAHNRFFEAEVWDFLAERGVVPEGEYGPWEDTADLAAWLGSKRDLASAAKAWLGLELSKLTRGRMTKRTLDELAASRGVEGRKSFRAPLLPEVERYCLADAEACGRLWAGFADQWPEAERKLARLTFEAGRRGVQVSANVLRGERLKYSSRLHEVEQSIPWARTKAPNSPVELRKWCLANDIEPPSTTADKSPEWNRWLERWESRAPTVAAVKEWRKVNRLLKFCTAVDRRLDGESTVQIELKYCGAHTGRWAGGGDLNLQNLPRSGELRNLFIARPGHRMFIADYSTIEPVILLWLADDEAALDDIRNGMDVYEQFARRAGLYEGRQPLKAVNPKLRQYCKMAVLSLGYQAGAKTLRAQGKAQFGVELSEAEAEAAVQTYREAYPLVQRMWWNLNDLAKREAGQGEFAIGLPSGRRITYRHTRIVPASLDRPYSEVWGSPLKNGPSTKVYGGKLCENCTQAVARDVLANGLMNLCARNSMHILFTVHDEIVGEVREASATPARREAILDAMTRPPEWGRDIPVAAEGDWVDRYVKL